MQSLNFKELLRANFSIWEMPDSVIRRNYGKIVYLRFYKYPSQDTKEELLTKIVDIFGDSFSIMEKHDKKHLRFILMAKGSR